MASIFDGRDNWNMAEAAVELGKLATPRLGQILDGVEQITVPYRGDLYQVRAIVDGFMVIGREADPVERCVPLR